MGRKEQQQTSFNGGMVSAYVEARDDITKYFTSVRNAENVFMMPEGGVRARAGTRKVASTKNDGVAYLFPFKPNKDNNFVLEFGNLYIRVFANGAPVGGTPIEIVTPYLIADIPQMLATGARESVDVLFLDAAGYAPRRLNRFTDTNWTLTVDNYDPPPTSEQDLPITVDVGVSVATTIAGFSGAEILAASSFFLDADNDKEFIYSSGKAKITAVTATKLTVDVEDVFPLISGAGKNYLYKTSTASGAGTTINFTAAHGLDVGDFIERAATGATTPSGEVRQVLTTPTTTQITINAAFGANPNTGTGWYAINPLGASLTALRGSPQTTFDPPAKEPVGKIMNCTTGADAFRVGVDENKIIKVYGGVLQIISVTSPTQVKTKILTTLVDSSTANPAAALAGSWRLESPIWSASRGYPTWNEFYQGRIWHGGGASDPTTVLGSRTNNYGNFATGALATDAVQYTYASGSFDRIHWGLAAGPLFLGNGNAEVTMVGNNTGEPIGGDVVPFVQDQSFRGSAAIRPERLSKSLIFVGKNASRIYRLVTDNESAELGKYKTLPANVLARDIESPGISTNPISVMRDPFPVAFLARSDGKLLTFTNDDDEDVHAFSVWSTDGVIESHAVIPHPDGNRDQIWLIVRRTINGVTKRYVEVVEDGGHGAIYPTSYTQFNLDCAILQYKIDTTAQTVFTGYGHLEGKTVGVMLYRTDQGTTVQNPRYLGQFTVSSGAITLNEEINYTCALEVGLDFNVEVETLRPGIPKVLTRNHTRKWTQLFLDMAASIPPTVNGEQMLLDYPTDTNGQIIADQGPSLVTGSRKVRSDEWRYDEDGRITINRSIPGPFQVLTMYGVVDFSGDFS